MIASQYRGGGASLQIRLSNRKIAPQESVKLANRLRSNRPIGPYVATTYLSLHVSGDVTSTRAARALSGAALRWLDRGGGPVWTYTHRWRQIERSAWPWVSVLASVERPADVARARDRGYVAAVTVPEYPDGHRAFPFGGLTAIPCPAEVGRMTCAQCGLCMDDDLLRERGLVIAFAAHGLNTHRVRLPIVQPQPQPRSLTDAPV